MKPVEKGGTPSLFQEYGDAKPDLIARIGGFCSYCEVALIPQSLHVEHIYPKDPHPELELQWNNFLLSCTTCNSYKNIHQGSVRQSNLERDYVWPHLENTFRAYEYRSDGRVEVRTDLSVSLQRASSATRRMVGLLLSPARAARYQDLGVAYDGVSVRSEMWDIAQLELDDYLENPRASRAEFISRKAAKMGRFSIWMEVFKDRPEVRREFINAFKADASCFDANTLPIPKGRL